MPLAGICKLFRNANVCVFGLKGTGKDVLFGNVIARSKYPHIHGKYARKPYASNLDYGGRYIPLDFSAVDMGKNTYDNFLAGKLHQYVYRYPMETDIYISDAGVYFPAQYCNELNKKYSYLPAFFALSRQVARCNVHVNMQYLGRVWDKIREQSETYILCRKCKVFFFGKICFMKVRIYDKYQSALDKVEPFRVRQSIFDKNQSKVNIDIERDKYRQTYGKVQNRILLFWNKSKHDTYYFERMLRDGKEE